MQNTPKDSYQEEEGKNNILQYLMFLFSINPVYY